MTTLLITTIKDVCEYVDTHPETRIGRAGNRNLRKHTLSDYLYVADRLRERGASMADILVEGSGR